MVLEFLFSAREGTAWVRIGGDTVQCRIYLEHGLFKYERVEERDKRTITLQHAHFQNNWTNNIVQIQVDQDPVVEVVFSTPDLAGA